MPKVITSIKALISHEGKFLLLKERIHKKDIWDLPGGKLEYGETPEEALKREVKEELCIDVEVGKSVGLWWFFSQHHKHQVICHTFLCTPPKKFEIDFTHNPADEEMVGFQWVTKEELLNQNFEGITDSLRELVANL